MVLGPLFLQLGIALGLGLLVGLQRERKTGDIAGFRTFPLVTLTGTLSGLLALHFGGLVLAGAFVALAVLVLVGNLAKIQGGHPDPGITTEVALLLMFAVGALLAVGPPQIAVAVGAATAVLLQLKEQLHGFAARLSEADLRAVMQFVVITLIVLPILPNRTYGPYDVLNPRQVWWMVVLIVGISLGGYVGQQLLGRRAGTLLGGVLGGLVSSTATTVTFARRTKAGAASAEVAAQVILIAGAIVYLRVLVEIGIVARALLWRALAPLGTMMVLTAVLALLRRRRGGDAGVGDDGSEPVKQDNPTELRAALAFAALYAVVLLAVAWAKARLGSAGLYAVAALSGLVDLDAIALSSAQLVRGGGLAADAAWRVVLLASLSNVAFKGAIVAAAGGRRLARLVLPLWGVVLLVGAAMLVFWPGEAVLLRLG
jgi:uncharacterized membrane protein (DUF4010 family)